MYYWEARQGGRPTVRICVHMAGGIGRRPCNVHMGSPTEREARDKDCVSYTEAHSWRSHYFPYNYAGAGERKDGQASGWHVFPRHGKDPKNSRHTPHICNALNASPQVTTGQGFSQSGFSTGKTTMLASSHFWSPTGSFFTSSYHLLVVMTEQEWPRK